VGKHKNPEFNESWAIPAEENAECRQSSTCSASFNMIGGLNFMSTGRRRMP
jgi:hypothetical protein